MALRVAVGQMTSTSKISSNLAQASEIVKKAAASHVQLLCLPECFALLQPEKLTSDQAKDFVASVLPDYQALAKNNNIWMALGGLQSPSSDPQKVRNTQYILSNTGEIQSSYSKVHLFDANVPGGAMFQESSFTEPGESAVVCPSPVGPLGLTICYDLRFPYQWWKLREMGANIILCPAAFTRPTGAAHWEVLLRARAIETQCYVIAAAQSGLHDEEGKRGSYGHSLIIDPWGTILCDLGEGDGPLCGVADIQPERLKHVRQQIPLDTHRRAELFFK